jgi:hypothetical protein
MSTENTQNLTGPKLDPLGSDNRPLSDRDKEIDKQVVKLLRKIEAVLNRPQKSIAKKNEPGARSPRKARKPKM